MLKAFLCKTTILSFILIMLLSLSGCKSFIEPSNKSSKDDDDDSVEVSSDDLDNESLENFRDVNTYDDAPAKNVTEEATEVIDFAKGFYTNWFKMRNSVEEDGEILYKDFKIEDPDYEGFYDLDYPSFYERYASSDEKEDPDYYSMDLIQSDVPSDYYSMPKTWDSVKILSGGDGFYKIGAVFTFEGFTYENGYDYDKRYKNKYYGTLTVIKEQDGWKVDSWTTYAPWDLYEDYRKSDKFLQSFEAKLEGKSQEVDTIIDADVTENSDGVVVESSIIMDESEGAASSPGTDLDLKSIIKENDSKTVAILGDTSQGSGFFLCEGIVVTNVHVIHKQKSLTVRLVDGTELEVAGVVVLNPSIDIAVLKLKEKFGEPVKLGNPDAMTKADEIVAIGSPMGLFNTVTIGLFQNIIVDGDARILQSSLPLAPGNSGGPLFNSKGELIGVNTSIVEGYADISFAMSSYHLVDVKESLDSIDFKKIKVTKLSEIDWEEN